MTRELRPPAYLRYVDDFLLFGDDKSQLWACRGAMIERLAGLRLTIHEESAQVRPTAHGIPFLGFVVYPTHRLLKRRKGIAYRRRLAGLLDAYRRGEIGRDAVGQSVLGWINHVRYGDTWGLRRAILREVCL